MGKRAGTAKNFDPLRVEDAMAVMDEAEVRSGPTYPCKHSHAVLFALAEALDVHPARSDVAERL